MSINIRKVDGGYLASATSPHIRGDWRTPHAFTRDEVIAALTGRGAHVTDIGDAFYAADPDWLSGKPN